MGKVFAELSVSLDGFIAGPNVTVGNGMGDGGERLHEWMFPSDGSRDRSVEARKKMFGSSGAVVVGRRMFDVGVKPWGENPPFHMPVFVVTHRAGDPIVKQGGTTYHFVTGGIEPALDRARAAAGERDVVLLGGADVIRQFVRADLIDELRIHLVPVLLGDGTRLFERMGREHIELECTRVTGAPEVAHLTFRVAK
ncbi:MAG TPA: dihydrofolate reductase family protein [Vicinamibacterales bacterium]|nr:dihydrofolate reductase family protein [Vicinamibacterales bacterium]